MPWCSEENNRARVLVNGSAALAFAQQKVVKWSEIPGQVLT